MRLWCGLNCWGLVVFLALMKIAWERERLGWFRKLCLWVFLHIFVLLLSLFPISSWEISGLFLSKNVLNFLYGSSSIWSFHLLWGRILHSLSFCCFGNIIEKDVTRLSSIDLYHRCVLYNEWVSSTTLDTLTFING